MSNEKPLVRNIAYSGAAAASNVLLIALIFAAARLLGDKSFGYFSFALALASIFETVIDLGMNTLAARNIARDRTLVTSYLPNILGWKMMLSIISMGLLAITVNLLSQSPEAETAAYILGAAIVLRSFKGTSHAFFQAYERFDLLVLTTYTERISVLLFGMIVLVLTRNLIAFCLVFALIRIPDLLYSYWLVHHKISPVHIGLERRTVRDLQVAAIPFGTYAVVTVMYASIGTVVLSAMRTPEQVGWYNASYKIYEGLTMFPYLLCAVLLPRLSKLFIADVALYRGLTVRMMKYLVLAAIPLAVLVADVAPQAISILYGKEYLPAVPVLRVLLLAMLLMFVNWLMNTALISANNEKVVLKIASIGLLIMASANAALVSRFGLMGAAYSVVISETSIFVLLAGAMKRLVFAIPAREITWRPVVACASAGVFLTLAHVTIPIGISLTFILIYVAVLFALRTFNGEELAAVKSLIGPRR